MTEEPALVGAQGAIRYETARASTTTEPGSSLPRYRDHEPDPSATTRRETETPHRPPTAVEADGDADEVEPRLPQPSRSSWPEIRFYVGAVALFFVSFALTTGLWVLGPVVVLGWEPVAITSGSMEPAIQVGDVVIFSERDPATIGRGTVVVFEDPSGNLVTHRVADVLDDGRFVTRGDNNPVDDSTPLDQTSVRGVGRVLVPFAGYPAVWTSGGTWLGLAFVAVLFGGLSYASRWAVLPKYSPWRHVP